MWSLPLVGEQNTSRMEEVAVKARTTPLILLSADSTPGNLLSSSQPSS